MTEETKAFARQVLALIDEEKADAMAWNDAERSPASAAEGVCEALWEEVAKLCPEVVDEINEAAYVEREALAAKYNQAFPDKPQVKFMRPAFDRCYAYFAQDGSSVNNTIAEWRIKAALAEAAKH